MVKKYLIFLWLLVFTGGFVNILSCASDNGSPGDLRISTQNLYLGADLSPVVTAIATIAAGGLANPSVFITNALDDIRANDIPSRAVAIAQIIAREEPHVIGLQEVSSFKFPDGDEFNFLLPLQSELTKEGLNYKIAIEVKGADITLPVTNPDGSAGMVSYKSSNVILVEDSLQVSDKEIKTYNMNLPPISLGGTVLSFPRSYARATLQREGASPFVVVHTHLEANPANSDIEIIQGIQAIELGLVLARITDYPVFLIGDLNSFAPDTGDAATGATSRSYEALALIATGLTDAYLEANSATETTANSTCCFEADLNITAEITDYGRVDHILYKGEGITASQVRFTGNEVGDRVTTSTSPARTIWPSDHLGVVGTFSGDL